MFLQKRRGEMHFHLWIWIPCFKLYYVPRERWMRGRRSQSTSVACFHPVAYSGRKVRRRRSLGKQKVPIAYYPVLTYKWPGWEKGGRTDWNLATVSVCVCTRAFLTHTQDAKCRDGLPWVIAWLDNLSGQKSKDSFWAEREERRNNLLQSLLVIRQEESEWIFVCLLMEPTSWWICALVCLRFYNFAVFTLTF